MIDSLSAACYCSEFIESSEKGTGGWPARASWRPRMNPLVQTPTEAPPPAVAWLAPISGDLEQVEQILTRTLHSGRPHVAQLVQHLGHYRGKRLRPILLL